MFQSLQIKGTIRPLQDWVVLEVIKEPAKTKGGILLPENAREYGRCPVVAVGPRCDLKVGDVVYIQKFVEGEVKFELNGKSVYMSREKHLNLTIEEEKTSPKSGGRGKNARHPKG